MRAHVPNRLSSRLPDAVPILLAVFAGIAGVAGSYAIAGFTPDFVAGPIAGLLARRLPAAVITFSIVVLGDLGERLAVINAVGLAVTLFAATSWLGWAVGRRLDTPGVGSTAGGFLTVVTAYLVTLAALPSLVAGLGAGLVLAFGSLAGAPVRDSGIDRDRRRVLAGAAGAIAFVFGGSVLGNRASGVSPTVGESVEVDLPTEVSADIEEKLAQATDQSLDIDGIEPLVSQDFYQVDINATDPTIDAEEWSLQVTGAVDEELTYSYGDIRARQPENRFVSLRCVGEALNGHKMDNALWTGVPIMELMEPAGVQPGCCVMLRADDGFYEEFPVEALRDGFLAFAMNGKELPRGHGHPARALIPGHWGEINVKWLTEIEILEEEVDGYWEERGWHGTGPVNTVAKIHAVNDLDDGRTELGGHAYAGTRGIQQVEVSTDGGQTWTQATLSDPLPGDDVWRQWAHRFEPPEGPYEVVARATDGTGTLQPEEESSAFPSGPSGLVTRSIGP
jgi:DMSO/TMAO reductase YedYZ molybdopterin-dependent catalytic subunit